ncbi:hypothetical protein LCGC14_0284610 [marine sediment metagenome]|uniref:RDD domain-containing protein n=1 Tax=marine sediment metagenome TaxID=412755 RepID=A0A0F9WGD5_9ZZZZ|nr:RDD family protein [Phycisphaerae bacterium]HDZ44219.1 RDD family protein [Phycisphaerae bacterium]
MSISPKHVLLACMVAAAVLLAAPVPGAAQESLSSDHDLLIAGSGDDLWIVDRHRDEETFDLLVWPVGGGQDQWRWLKRGLSGRVDFAIVLGRRLHVLSSAPTGRVSYSAVDGDSLVGRNPQDPRWPKAIAPLAACDATGFGDARGPSILTVVPRRLPGEGAEQAEPAPPATGLGLAAPVMETYEATLGIFQTVAGQWRHVADLEAIPLTPQTTVLAATAGDALYVMVRTAGPPGNRLYAWRNGQWSRPDLPHPLADGTIVSMDGLGGKLTVLLTSAGAEGQIGLTVSTLTGDGTFSHQTVLRDEEAVLWPADTMLLATVLGNRLAVVWSTEDKVQFLLVASNGTAEPPQPIGIFSQPEFDQDGGIVMQYVFITLVLATLACMLLGRSAQQLTLQALPKSVRPAHLLKRLLAQVIDLAPILLIASAAMMYWYVKVNPILTLEEMDSRPSMDVITRLTKTQVSAVISAVAMGVFLIYGVAMETLRGATLGKTLMGLRVVSLDGKAITVRQALIRNLLKVLILLAITMLLLLLLLPVLTAGRQRLGDLLARTIVVEPTGLPAEPPPEPADSEDTDSHENA